MSSRLGVVLPQSALEARIQQLTAERDLLQAKLEEYRAANQDWHDRFQAHIFADAVMALNLPALAAMLGPGSNREAAHHEAERAQERPESKARLQSQRQEKGVSVRHQRR